GPRRAGQAPARGLSAAFATTAVRVKPAPKPLHYAPWARSHPRISLLPARAGDGGTPPPLPMPARVPRKCRVTSQEEFQLSAAEGHTRIPVVRGVRSHLVTPLSVYVK